MSRNRFVDDILDLCDEQGFRHVLLAGKTGVRVFPKATDHQPLTLYFHSSGNGHEAANMKAAVRRIGVRFPEDIERSKREQKRMVTMVDDNKKIASPITLGGFVAPAKVANPFDAMRAKLNVALTALGELEVSINDAEREAKEMQELKALMRKVL